MVWKRNVERNRWRSDQDKLRHDAIECFTHQQKTLSGEYAAVLQFRANVDINQGHESWFDALVDGIVHKTGLARSEAMDIIARFASLTDKMKYVQLGHPELVVIEASTREDVLREVIEQRGRDT